ncbi:MAG: transporter substrate-binding protein [Cryptosporangiaceae bacterium]|jgi:phospholipid/cholesterol/gamma-HCH transport system substrate-binding protein|nr:transporter substrate-binding protein [Cryptosporangiaceae bacterium]
MKPFRERNTAVVGVVGLTALGVLLTVAFNADNLPIIGGGATYHAAFTEAAGLQAGNEVRVAGVKVGKVTGLGLDGPKVRVDFRVADDSVRLGKQTAATIRIKTVLGQKYLSLEPSGSGRLQEGDVIPLSRTASPFDVQDALGGLADTVDQIDTKQLATAFGTIADTFKDSPAEVSASLDGLSRLSTTIASRDAQLSALLGRTRTVTAVLAERDTEFQRLVADGNLLLAEISRRREAIHTLLVSTTQLSQQLIALVGENRAQLEPALKQLRGVVSILEANQTQIDQTVPRLARFVYAFSNVLGNGRWFDSYVACLMPPPVTVEGVPLSSCDPGSNTLPTVRGGK